jgi:hypothetical protein
MKAVRLEPKLSKTMSKKLTPLRKNAKKRIDYDLLIDK